MTPEAWLALSSGFTAFGFLCTALATMYVAYKQTHIAADVKKIELATNSMMTGRLDEKDQMIEQVRVSSYAQGKLEQTVEDAMPVKK